jgi:hypothetical protein
VSLSYADGPVFLIEMKANQTYQSSQAHPSVCRPGNLATASSAGPSAPWLKTRSRWATRFGECPCQRYGVWDEGT